MKLVTPKLLRSETAYHHWCDGCNSDHPLPDSWTFDGNLESPTFSPSFRQYAIKHLHEECHYFIQAGKIVYCQDAQHALAGKTVDLPDMPKEMIQIWT